LTYSKIDHASSRLAKSLVRHGLKRGDRVAIFMENCPEAVIAIYAILKGGGVFVVAEATATAHALRHIVTDSGARILIAHNDRSAVVKDAFKSTVQKCPVVWVSGDRRPASIPPPGRSWSSIVEEPNDDVVLPRIIDVDLAALIYTSGSTGRPKGIMCTHHNMVSAARSIIQYIENNDKDVILDVLPLAFDYGLYQVIMAFMFGGTIVLERSIAYLEPLIRTIEKEKVTGFPVVPTIIAMLLRMKRFPSDRLKSLRYITSTGAAWPVAHIRKIRELLPHVTIFSMFGLTECKRVGFLPPGLIDDKPDSIGKAMPNSEISVVDRNGNIVRPGSKGELVVRGSNVMQGYWNDPPTSERTFRKGRYPADRHLHSGDWMRLGKDGLLYFVGRHDDLIKTLGRRVSPREVEEIVALTPGISEAAAIGVPDEVNGKVVAVFAVAKEKKIGKRHVQAFCKEKLEPYKVPKYVWIIDCLPKSPNGKIDKKRLLDLAAERVGL
jgi:amino acid adenylation domain-containing protein